MKYLIFFLLLCLARAALQAQYYFSSGNIPEPELRWAWGASVGVANCLTDIGGKNGPGQKLLHDVNWSQSRAALTAEAGATWHAVVGLRASCSAARISGEDAVLRSYTSSGAHDRYRRNLGFSTTVGEAALALELYPLPLVFPEAARHNLSAFLQAGAALLYYNPRAWYQGHWVNLRDLHTEGQGFPEYPARRPYSNFTWSIPAGFGIQYDPGGACMARLQFCYRFTGTDYLDDVSTTYIDPRLFIRHLPDKDAALAAALADRTGEIASGESNPPGAVRGNPKNRDAWFTVQLSINWIPGRMRHK